MKENCSLQEHYNYYSSSTAYTFEYCNAGSTSWNSTNKTIQTAINETAWDYVIFQNSLENSGRYGEDINGEAAGDGLFQPYLDDLITYVLSTSQSVHGKQPVIGWNMFWPISVLAPENSPSEWKETLIYRLGFYEGSSAKMFEKYIESTQALVAADPRITLVIPSGTAVENLRCTSLNTAESNEFTRDTYHMSYGAGRYIAACSWFEAIVKPLTGVSVVGNTYRNAGTYIPVTDSNAELIQRCAKAAVDSPYVINTTVETTP